MTLRPHIFRTSDDGKSWQEIVRGLPNDENVNVVREDSQRRGPSSPEPSGAFLCFL